MKAKAAWGTSAVGSRRFAVVVPERKEVANEEEEPEELKAYFDSSAIKVRVVCVCVCV